MTVVGSIRSIEKIGGMWGIQCLNTRFPLPTLCAGYSVKLFFNKKIVNCPIDKYLKSLLNFEFEYDYNFLLKCLDIIIV